METETLLKDFSQQEKTAYLHAIASLATADRSASPEEIEYLTLLSQKAQLTPQEQNEVLSAAKTANDTSLTQSLNVLKNSDLRFSLVADLIQFANSDNNYSAEEKKSVERIASYLNVSEEQYSALNQFVNETQHQAAGQEPSSINNFLGSSGIGQKLQGAGINIGSLTSGLLGMVGPMILSKVMGGNRGGGGFGIPGMGGNLGSLGGGLGSIIAGLGGKQSIGHNRSTGGGGITDILSKLL